MKRLLLSALAILGSVNLYAQDETDSFSVEAKDSALYYHGNTAIKSGLYKVNREKIVYRRAFLVNNARDGQEVYDRALAFARSFGSDNVENSKKKSITIPVTWRYNGAANECVEDLALTGNLLIEIKDLKTRISLKDLNYIHYDRNSKLAKPVAKSDLFSKRPDCAPVSGKAELLYNCTACQQSMRSVESHLESQFEQFATQYQETLKRY